MQLPALRRIAILQVVLLCASCAWRSDECFSPECFDEQSAGCGPGQLEIEHPTPSEFCCDDQPIIPPSPEEVGENANVSYVDMSLDQAIAIAMRNSKVMRDLGGTVLQTPSAVGTVYDPSIVFTDPRFGEEGTLSQFDANLSAGAFFENNDRRFNNVFVGQGGDLVQDLANFQVELNKRAATGTQFTLRHVTDYDFNNNAGNRFTAAGTTSSGAWTTYFDAELRQPLLQGAGVEFNRTAGPSSEPGVVNGVLVARIRSDISLANFEMGVRDLVSDVENAYWDLYYAYRDLHSKIKARDAALASWRAVKSAVGRPAGTADKEGQAREQYYRFQGEVIDALNGRLIEATRNRNGSSPGTFRSQGGVRVAERRLRLMIGLPINSIRLLRPADEPIEAPVRFDWASMANESMDRRPELRKQKWLVKQRELELLANRNFLLPQLDVVGRYRWRGFGQHLLKDRTTPLDNAYGDLVSSNRQEEWQLGVEYSLPIGFRRAHAAVRNSEQQLARSRAVLREQQHTVMYALSNAVGELRRSFESRQAQFNRRLAAHEQLQAVQAAYEADRAPLDLVLEAQRRLVDTEIRFYQSQVEYQLSIKRIHYEKGSSLEYANVMLAEGASNQLAYCQAQVRDGLRGRMMENVCRDYTISQGPYNPYTLKTPPAVLPAPEQAPTPAPAVPVEPAPAPDSAPKAPALQPATPDDKQARDVGTGFNRPVNFVFDRLPEVNLPKLPQAP